MTKLGFLGVRLGCRGAGKNLSERHPWPLSQKMKPLQADARPPAKSLASVLAKTVASAPAKPTKSATKADEAQAWIENWKNN